MSNARTWLKAVSNLLLVVACLAVGLWLGPQLRAGYQRLFPPPEYATGDYAGLYRQTGKPVVMFTTSVCPFCAQARALLQREGVAYHEFVVDRSPDARRRFDALGGGGVPQLFVGGRRITGYREATILESLAAAGARKGTSAQ